MQISGRTFQANETANTKTLRQKHACRTPEEEEQDGWRSVGKGKRAGR